MALAVKNITLQFQDRAEVGEVGQQRMSWADILLLDGKTHLREATGLIFNVGVVSGCDEVPSGSQWVLKFIQGVPLHCVSLKVGEHQTLYIEQVSATKDGIQLVLAGGSIITVTPTLDPGMATLSCWDSKSWLAKVVAWENKEGHTELKKLVEATVSGKN